MTDIRIVDCLEYLDSRRGHKSAVFPHNEIGTDPGAIKAFAQGEEDLVSHLLIYDHVLGADPDREAVFAAL